MSGKNVYKTVYDFKNELSNFDLREKNQLGKKNKKTLS